MRDDLPQLLPVLDEAEQLIASLAAVIVGNAAEFAATCECANRVCDRYEPAQAA